MTMSKQETLAKWKEVSNLIASEISNNEEFAQKMERILKGETVAVTSKRRSRRSPAKLDPLHLLEMGEEILAKELEKLNVEELKDIVSEYGMDTSRLALKWKDRKRLELLIMDATKRKSSRGEAFWNSQTQ